MLEDLVNEGGAALAYGAVGVALMALGYLVVDLLTPGKLGQLIWADRNRGAGLVLAAKLLGVGAIVTTAILTSEDSLGEGIVSTVVYGVLGIVLTSLAFLVLDAITPGRLGAIVVEAVTGDAGDERDSPAATSQTSSGPGIHPACWVVAATDLATAAIIAAAIS
ncbi:DUF350 domain-containing protein [Actinomadura sp. HBU206391]|uniref:DUF350 domain-containing protein n=1 Tax=Actinomadura sp. HBU206391 TaxID=2731692 RepID=UPI00164FF67D|nr:DUF350 domain-containing protein [Actinomadura sp. HBU206391]MBC6457807.1 DUF350 domain-containing protein [Actinomadura sp. HBU206391]